MSQREGQRSGSASTHVAADPDRVWQCLSDVTALARWSPEGTTARWLDDASGPVVGAQFKGSNKRGWSRWSTTCTVTESEPGRVFAFAVGAKPDTVWRYEISPSEGGCEVTESYTLHHPLTAAERTITWLTTGVRRRETDLVDGMKRTLLALKNEVESAAP